MIASGRNGCSTKVYSTDISVSCINTNTCPKCASALPKETEIGYKLE